MGPKIFNIGLNRAGTTSLTTALGLLGYRALHFHHEGRRLYDLIAANQRRHYRLFDGLDADHDAFSDFAGQNFFRVLDKQYPGSKFILTWRDLDAWLDSRERKVRRNVTRPGYRYAFRTVDRAGWQREREGYLADLDSYFAGRPGDLLTIDIPGGEGWDRLCPFLGREAPPVPFPFENRLAATA